MGGLKPSGFSATQHTLIRRLPMPTTASTYNHLIALLPRNYERIHQQRRAPLRAGDEVISDLLSPNYWSLPLLLLPRNASATRVVVARANKGREEHSHGVALLATRAHILRARCGLSTLGTHRHRPPRLAFQSFACVRAPRPGPPPPPEHIPIQQAPVRTYQRPTLPVLSLGLSEWLAAGTER